MKYYEAADTVTQFDNVRLWLGKNYKKVRGRAARGPGAGQRDRGLRLPGVLPTLRPSGPSPQPPGQPPARPRARPRPSPSPHPAPTAVRGAPVFLHRRVPAAHPRLSHRPPCFSGRDGRPGVDRVPTGTLPSPQGVWHGTRQGSPRSQVPAGLRPPWCFVYIQRLMMKAGG